METSSDERTVRRPYPRKGNNCTPIEELMGVGCREKNESILEEETYRDCGEYCFEDFGM